jgi:WD40 repeat protein
MRVCLILCATAGLASAAAPPVHVGPLPAGAIARLGSPRFRAGGPIYSLAISSDGKRLASGTERDIQLWDTATGRRLGVLEGPPKAQRFLAVAFSLDSSRLLGGAKSGHLCQWDIASGKLLRVLDVQTELRHVVWAPERGRAVAIGVAGMADLWDLTQGKHLLVLAGKVEVWSDAVPTPTGPGMPAKRVLPRRGISYATFSPDGKHLALLVDRAPFLPPTTRFEVEVIDAGTARPEARFSLKAACSMLRFTPSGKQLNVITGKRLEFHDASTGRRFRTFTLAECGGERVFVWRDGKHVIPARKYSTIDDEARQAQHGSTRYTAGERGVIQVWDVETGKEKPTPASPTAALHHLGWTADGHSLLTASDNGCIRFWEARTGKLLRTLGPLVQCPIRVQSSKDGRTLLTWAPFDGRRNIRLIDGASGKERALPEHFPLHSWPELSSDGRWLAVQERRAVCLWDLASGKRLHALETGDATERELVFSPDSRYLAMRSSATERQLWDLSGRRPRLRVETTCYLPVRLHGLAGPLFSPDSRTLACMPRGSDLRLIETATGEERATRKVRAPSAQYHSGSAQLGHLDGFTRTVGVFRVLHHARNEPGNGPVWVAPLDSSVPPVELPGQWGRPMPAFSPGGRLLASAARDGSVLVWDSERFLPWHRTIPQPGKRADSARCWTDLSSPNARVAMRAIEELIRDPDRSVAFLARHLRPPAARHKQIARLISDLDSDEYARRRQAEAELRNLGETAREPLQAALAGKLSLHARRSIERLLKNADRTAEEVRLLRAVEALERCRTLAAGAVLDRLARQESAAWFRREVQAARARLAGMAEWSLSKRKESKDARFRGTSEEVGRLLVVPAVAAGRRACVGAAAGPVHRLHEPFGVREGGAARGGHPQAVWHRVPGEEPDPDDLLPDHLRPHTQPDHQ